MGVEVPEGLEPRSPRWMPGQPGSSAAARRPLPVCTAAQRLREAARAQRGRRVPERSGGRVGGEWEAAGSTRESGLAAGWAAVAAEVEAPPPLKRRSHSWASRWPMGGGRAGSGRGRLGSSPPPAARRTAFQLESEGGGGGAGLEERRAAPQTRCRPRGPGAPGSALWLSRPPAIGSACASWPVPATPPRRRGFQTNPSPRAQL